MNPQRVLVITKHRFLGDTIAALPLMAAVRRTFPKATVDLLTGYGAATLLERSPLADRVLPIAPRSSQRGAAGSLRLTAALVRIARQLRADARPDLCLIPDRSLRSAAAACLTGASVRVGFDTEGRGRLLTHPVPYRNDRREVECCLDLLRAVATEPTDPPWDTMPHLEVSEDERAEAGALLEADVSPWIGLQPGASHDDKAWPEDRWGALGGALLSEGRRVVITGGPDETEVAARVAAAIGERALNLTGRTRMRETMGLLSRLDCFVSADTGLGHIAAALGRPTVTLFGPTPAHKWRNTGPHNRTLVAEDGRMESIPVDSVRALVAEFVGAGP